MSASRKPVIVVGVSGSRASRAALRWAVDEADRRHAHLTVIRTWEHPARAYYAHPASDGELELEQEHARRDLAAIVRGVLGPGPRADTTTEVVEGMAERALIDCSVDADLLVLGSASPRPADPSVGPVIRACLSRAHCPVVVVGPQNSPGRGEDQPDSEPTPNFGYDFLVSAGLASEPRARS